MEVLLKGAETAHEVKRIQCVLLGASGITSFQISPLVGYHPGHIRKVWVKYQKEGEEGILGEKRGQSRGRAHLSFEEEKAFLAPFIKKAKEGGILIVSEIHKSYERYIKKKVNPTVVYRLLHRHGWRKLAPRPHHPKGDQKKREGFKASFPPQAYSGWCPSKD